MTFQNLPKGVPVPSQGTAVAPARSPASKADWVRSGELVPIKRLARAWGLTRPALRPAEKRGEVFSLLVAGQRYFPREFLEIERAHVAAVCKQLVRLTAAEKLDFWKCPHGALGGHTVAQVLRAGTTQLPRVVQLANALAAGAGAEAA